jgi:hypothetical protein
MYRDRVTNMLTRRHLIALSAAQTIHVSVRLTSIALNFSKCADAILSRSQAACRVARPDDRGSLRDRGYKRWLWHHQFRAEVPDRRKRWTVIEGGCEYRPLPWDVATFGIDGRFVHLFGCSLYELALHCLDVIGSGLRKLHNPFARNRSYTRYR